MKSEVPGVNHVPPHFPGREACLLLLSKPLGRHQLPLCQQHHPSHLCVLLLTPSYSFSAPQLLWGQRLSRRAILNTLPQHKGLL